MWCASRVYVAFCPSTSKQVTKLADPEILRGWAKRSKTPSCAISGVGSHPEGLAAGVRAINAAIKRAQVS